MTKIKLNLQPKFFGDFTSAESVADQFRVTIPETDEILVAVYGVDDESYGEAFVLFLRDGVLLYEVNGSHCSCSGLGGDWSPELVNVAELRACNRPALRNEDSAAAVRAALDAFLAAET